MSVLYISNRISAICNERRNLKGGFIKERNQASGSLVEMGHLVVSPVDRTANDIL